MDNYLTYDAQFAYTFADKLHRGQFYKSAHETEPYINHLFRVAMNFRTEESELQVIALLHDSIEDVGVPVFILEKLFGEHVSKCVFLLTRMKGENYLKDYIPKVAVERDAARVKLADLNDNIYHCELDLPERETQLKRYLKAKKYIEEHLYG